MVSDDWPEPRRSQPADTLSSREGYECRSKKRTDVVCEPPKGTWRSECTSTRMTNWSELIHSTKPTTSQDGGKPKTPDGKRFYAIVHTADGVGLCELLVQNGLARIYGVRTPLPDGRTSREYLARLDALEQQAKSAQLGGWRR